MDCLKCKKEILITKTEEDGSGWMKLGESKKIKYDGNNEYVVCQFCGAKNILSNVPSKIKGALAYSFTRYED